MRKAVVVDMQRCQPEECEGGVCQARLACPLKALWQEEPYTEPMVRGMCTGCSKCLPSCPARAIVLS